MNELIQKIYPVDITGYGLNMTGARYWLSKGRYNYATRVFTHSSTKEDHELLAWASGGGYAYGAFKYKGKRKCGAFFVNVDPNALALLFNGKTGAGLPVQVVQQDIAEFEKALANMEFDEMSFSEDAKDTLQIKSSSYVDTLPVVATFIVSYKDEKRRTFGRYHYRGNNQWLTSFRARQYKNGNLRLEFVDLNSNKSFNGDLSHNLQEAEALQVPFTAYPDLTRYFREMKKMDARDFRSLLTKIGTKDHPGGSIYAEGWDQEKLLEKIDLQIMMGEL